MRQLADILALKGSADIAPLMQQTDDTVNYLNSFQYSEGKYPDLYKSKGFLVDDFVSEWTARDAYGVVAIDTDKSKYGRGSLHVQGNTADQNVEIIKTINMSFAELKAIQGVWVYLYDTTTMNSFNFYISSLTGTVTGTRFSTFKVCNVMKVGWNFVRIFEADWTAAGGESWDNTMKTLVVRGVTNTGQTVNFNIGGWLGAIVPEPVLLIEFDDCLKSAYTEGFKYMASKNLRGTMNMTGNLVENAAYVNIHEYKSIKENGWTVGNHGNAHVDFRTLTKAQQLESLNAVRDIIVSNGLGDGLQVAFPYGYYNSDTIALMRENGYKTGRQVLGEANNTVNGNSEFPYSLTCLAFDQTKTLTDATNALADVKAKQSVGIFLFHDLLASAGANAWAISDFRTLIDAIVADGIKVITRDELYWHLQNI